MIKKSFFISASILVMSMLAVYILSARGVPSVVKTNLENIPSEILGFKASDDFFSDAVYQELNADKHVYRHYRDTSGKQIDLYIGYYGTAKGGRTAHNPYGCLPGAGWGIIHSKKITLRAENYPRKVSVNYILSQKGNTYETMFHWYQSSGNKVLDTGVQLNIQRFKGRLFKNRNDGAYVQLSVTSRKNELKESEVLLKVFAKEILKIIPEYWPVEK